MARTLVVGLIVIGLVTGPAGAATSPEARCAAAKLKAANKKTSAKLKCHQI